MRSHWSRRVVFVTGATGLLGGWLTQKLVQQGAQVVVLVRDHVPSARIWSTREANQLITIQGDLSDRNLLERVIGEHEVNTVFHLAAQTIVGIANRNPISTFEANIAGTWNILEACRRSPLVSEVVVASSDKAYGAQDVLPYTEDTPLQGRHPYDVSKSCTDLIALSYAHSFGLPVCVTRCGNLFGGGDLNWNRLIPGTIRALLDGDRPVIRSDGHFRRDYFYVEDAAEAYLHLAEALSADRNLAGEAFNFSLGKSYSAREIVDLLRDALGSHLEPVILGEAINEIRDQHLDASKALSRLGWTPRYSLQEGLARTVSWYADHLDAKPHAIAA